VTSKRNRDDDDDGVGGVKLRKTNNNSNIIDLTLGDDNSDDDDNSDVNILEHCCNLLCNRLNDQGYRYCTVCHYPSPTHTQEDLLNYWNNQI
jgi:hypothetical protein